MGCIAGAHVDTASLSGLRKEHTSFFPEFRTVSVICKLNVFSGGKNNKKEACSVDVL